jgi:hypothetical protein
MVWNKWRHPDVQDVLYGIKMALYNRNILVQYNIGNEKFICPKYIILMLLCLEYQRKLHSDRISFLWFRGMMTCTDITGWK